MVKPISIIQVTRPESLPLSLEDVKSYLKITHSHDDDLLKMLVASVASKCEIYTGLSLISKDFRLEYNGLNNKLHIPIRPLKEVRSVFSGNQLSSNKVGAKYYSINQDYIIMHTFFSGQIYIYCSCGFGDSDKDIPPELKLIMNAHVADLYETRGNQSNFNMDSYNDFRFFKI